jgi:hypothetical protein
MCSSTCATPVVPFVSSMLPARYQTMCATVGARRSSLTMTRRPFASCARAGWPATASGQSGQQSRAIGGRVAHGHGSLLLEFPGVGHGAGILPLPRYPSALETRKPHVWFPQEIPRSGHRRAGKPPPNRRRQRTALRGDERLKAGLARTRAQFGGKLKALFSRGKVDDELLEELETSCWAATSASMPPSTCSTTCKHARPTRPPRQPGSDPEGAVGCLHELLLPLEEALDVARTGRSSS